MRSHLANLPLPPKTPQKQEDTQPPMVSTSSDCSEEEEKEMNSTSSTNEDQKGVVYGLRKNPKKSVRLAVADPPQSADDAGLVVVQDGESEAESTKKPTRKRSKRTRRMLVSKQQPSSTESMVELEQVSSVSNTNSPEEDLAMCLIMLSRDVWSTTTSTDSDEFSQQELQLSNKVMKMSNKRCKKIKINCWEDNYDEEGELEEFPRNVVCSNSRIRNVVDKKVHECPFCGKVFGSGQALGGHKRSHFLGSTTTATTTTTTTTTSVSNSAKLAAAETESLLVPSSSNSAKFQHEGMFMIDLNLPAPVEEEG